jgi:acyl-ACP thioesterase
LDLSTTQNFKIRACETDHLGQLKLSAIFQLMQEAAEANAKTLKLNYDEINANNEIWVLSRIKAKFFNIPKWEDEISIKTWPMGVDGIFAIRDYLIKTTDDDLVGKITSSWLIVDAKNRRVKRMREFPEGSNDFILGQSAEKIRPDSLSLESYNKYMINEISVNYSSETRLGDKIGIYHSKINDNKLYITAKNESLEKISLIAKIQLSERVVI